MSVNMMDDDCLWSEQVTEEADMVAARAWLDMHGIGLTGEQIRRFTALRRDINERFADAQVREMALVAAARYLSGDLDPKGVGEALAEARLRVDGEMAAAMAVATLAVADGHQETATAREVGVDRMTLRRWLGKR